MKRIEYSVVVPVYDEEGSVVKLHREIVEVFKKLNKASEIIFVDDGSKDKTFEKLKALKPITIIRLRKNFGQSSALDAGIKHARGKIIITLDGDGQNDPRDIPKLLKKLNGGYDAVCGWRHKRRDPFVKRKVSQGAKFFRDFLVKDGIHDSGCTLRVYRRECFEDIDLHGEMHRMIPALLRWGGFRITEEKVNHRFRTTGVTKYNWRRIVKGFLDMVQIWFWRKYESRPLYLFGALGIFLVIISTLLLVILAFLRFFTGYGLSDKIWPLVGMTGFITGIQFIIFGILSDLIIKNRPDRRYYKIRDVITK